MVVTVSGGKKTIVAVGEALWDVLPGGRQPGGAPCNVAFHTAQLTDRGAIVTRVGDDAAGSELVALLRDRAVDTEFVQRDPSRPTGSVSVTIEDADPRYTIASDVAWDYIVAVEAARALVRTSDAICVGSLAQRSEASRAAIQQFLLDARGRALVVFDVNLRPPFIDASVIEGTLRVVDVVKMSESELAQLSALLDRPGLIRWLLQDVGVRAVCVTRGGEGASMSTQHETVSARGMVVDTSVGDPVGAGDAFTAAMAHKLVRNAPAEEILQTANRYAALVATKQGAMPVLSRDELAGIDS
jgi:fructokinase